MNTASGCAAFRLGFPTSCLRRHVGAPTGLKPKILLHAITKIFCISVEQGMIMEAEEPTVRAGPIPSELTAPPPPQSHREDNTIRYDRRCYFNVCSKANISQLNLPHGTDN